MGAFERDNFGDLLFLSETRRYLEEFPLDITASAPFPSTGSVALPGYVRGYVQAAQESRFELVWVVGGEVGGTTVQDAFRMSSSEELFDECQQLSRSERRRRITELSGLSDTASPYLPRMSALPETLRSTLVVNSVGLSGVRALRGTHRQEVIHALREATFISVRDRASSDLLNDLALEHILAPDLIQSILLSHQPDGAAADHIALVQVKASILREFGVDNFAAILASSRELRNFEIRLFSAGSARGHDSNDLYRRLQRSFKEQSNGRELSLSQALDPISKVDEIAKSGLWVGTSLHGLIISSAYDVPRVGLELQKLVNYGRTWAETMPIGVVPDDLNSAIETALGDSEQSKTSGRARELAQMALSSAQQGIAAAISISVSDIQLQKRIETERLISSDRLLLRRRLLDSSRALVPLVRNSAISHKLQKNLLVRTMFNK